MLKSVGLLRVQKVKHIHNILWDCTDEEGFCHYKAIERDKQYEKEPVKYMQ